MLSRKGGKRQILPFCGKEIFADITPWRFRPQDSNFPIVSMII